MKVAASGAPTRPSWAPTPRRQWPRPATTRRLGPRHRPEGARGQLRPSPGAEPGTGVAAAVRPREGAGAGRRRKAGGSCSNGEGGKVRAGRGRAAAPGARGPRPPLPLPSSLRPRGCREPPGRGNPSRGRLAQDPGRRVPGLSRGEGAGVTGGPGPRLAGEDARSFLLFLFAQLY